MHRNTTRLFSAAMVVIGIAMVARTIAAGGGPVASGVVLGVLFCALGIGRLVVSRHG